MLLLLPGYGFLTPSSCFSPRTLRTDGSGQASDPQACSWGAAWEAHGTSEAPGSSPDTHAKVGAPWCATHSLSGHRPRCATHSLAGHGSRCATHLQGMDPVCHTLTLRAWTLCATHLLAGQGPQCATHSFTGHTVVVPTLYLLPGWRGDLARLREQGPCTLEVCWSDRLSSSLATCVTKFTRLGPADHPMAMRTWTCPPVPNDYPRGSHRSVRHSRCPRRPPASQSPLLRRAGTEGRSPVARKGSK